jgi:hypothetical protein
VRTLSVLFGNSKRLAKKTLFLGVENFFGKEAANFEIKTVSFTREGKIIQIGIIKNKAAVGAELEKIIGFMKTITMTASVGCSEKFEDFTGGVGR